MAGWNGSGTFTKTHSWVADAANGIKIRADRHDANDTDFTNGINNCITKDGQNSATNNLPMNGNIHTGVGNATARNNYLAMGQFQDGSGVYVATTGSANTYVANLSPSVTAYVAGQKFLLNINATNTGASTINFNAVGAKSIVKNGATALQGGELVSGRLYTIIYDGTNFQVVNPTPLPEIISGAHSSARTNEVPLDSQTLSKTTNGDITGTQYELHYKYLWDNFADGQAPVAGGRGASAQADWDADKAITTPDFQDRVVMGVSSGGSITTVGDTTGATTVASSGTIGGTTLSVSQIPSHSHFLIRDETVSNQGGAIGSTTPLARRDNTGNDSAYWLSPGTATANVGKSSDTGGGSSHNHAYTGDATSIVQKSIGLYWYLRA
jgi:microcystin-dependent protein